MEDRKSDADAHLAAARSQNTETGISGFIRKIRKALQKREIVSCGALFALFQSKLAIVKIGIKALFLKQLGMTALFNNFAVFHYQDDISVFNG